MATTKSELSSSRSSVTRSAPSAATEAASTYGSATTIFQPNGRASASNSRPMPPAPMTPSVRVVNPRPMKLVRSCQRPVRVSRSFWMRRPASAKMKVSAATATGRRTATGVLVATTPRAARARTSTESYPTPWRATIFTRRSPRATDAALTRGEFT